MKSVLMAQSQGYSSVLLTICPSVEPKRGFRIAWCGLRLGGGGEGDLQAERLLQTSLTEAK